MTLKIGWFTTARGIGSRGFFEFVQRAIKDETLDASIEFVFCNREKGESDATDSFIELVSDCNVPIIPFSSSYFKKQRGGKLWKFYRDEYHHEVISLVEKYNVDMCVLAGYMLIVSDEVCRRLLLINLHPAMPGGPVGTWQNVIWKLIEQKYKDSGAMMHIVTEVLDSGPVISYDKFPIVGEDFDDLWKSVEGVSIDKLTLKGEDQPLFSAIRSTGVLRERPLLIQTLIAIAENKLKVTKTSVSNPVGLELQNGINLTFEVDEFLRKNN